MKTTPCKGCGRPMVWGKTIDGKRIPLDPKPPVYSIEVQDDGSVKCAKTPHHMFMVSHFATCPKANDFSGSKKKGSDDA